MSNLGTIVVVATVASTLSALAAVGIMKLIGAEIEPAVVAGIAGACAATASVVVYERKPRETDSSA